MTDKQALLLRVEHGAAAVMHTVSAITFLVYSGGGGWSPAIEVTHETWVPVDCVYNNSLRCFRQTRTTDVHPFSIVAVCVLFVAWSAAVHVFTTTHIGWSMYVHDLAKGVSRLRWCDYGISSSLMITAVAPIAGIVDLWTILCMTLLQAVVILMGMLSEYARTVRQQWLWFAGSSIVYIVGVWTPLLTTFFQSVGAIPSEQSAVGSSLRAGFGAFFALYSSFAVVAFVNLATRYRYYLACEQAYIILSLTAKALIVWVVYISWSMYSQMLTNEVYTPVQSQLPAANAIYTIIACVLCVGIALSIIAAILWRCSRGGIVRTIVRREPKPSDNLPSQGSRRTAQSRVARATKSSGL